MKGTFSLRLHRLLLLLSFSQFAFHCFGVLRFVCRSVAVPDRQKAHLSSVNYRTIRVEFCNLFSVSVGCNKCSYIIVGQFLLVVLLVFFFCIFFCFLFCSNNRILHIVVYKYIFLLRPSSSYIVCDRSVGRCDQKN